VDEGRLSAHRCWLQPSATSPFVLYDTNMQRGSGLGTLSLLMKGGRNAAAGQQLVPASPSEPKETVGPGLAGGAHA